MIAAPAPFAGSYCGQAQPFSMPPHGFFAAKETSKATAQDDVSARAAQILDAHGNAILRYAYSYPS